MVSSLAASSSKTKQVVALDFKARLVYNSARIEVKIGGTAHRERV